MPEETIVVVMEVVVCPHEGEPCSYAHYCEYTERPGDPACGNGPLRRGFLINDAAICDNHGIELTEDEVSDPFKCDCGSPCCYGVVNGYKYLSADARARLEGEISPYLRRRYA